MPSKPKLYRITGLRGGARDVMACSIGAAIKKWRKALRADGWSASEVAGEPEGIQTISQDWVE